MNERELLLSEAVDCITRAMELEDDARLRMAREWLLDVAMGERSWWRRLVGRFA